MNKSEAAERLYDNLRSAVSTLDSLLWDLPPRQREPIRREIDDANRALNDYRIATSNR